MDLLSQYGSSIARYGSTYRFPIAVGVGSLVVGALAIEAMKSYFGGGVCYSKAKLTGKTVVITGANTGIGLETAVDLAKRGARVILACRDVARGKAAVADVKQRSKSDDVTFSQLDLASLQSVREFSERTLEEEPRIDILINNAGVMIPPFSTTKDGFELQFGVNHLGHFLLTNLLLDRIKKAPAGRVVTVSSMAHRSGRINFEDLQSKQSYSRMGAYAQSKLANILFTQSLAKRLRGTNVTAYSLHPGSVLTELQRHVPGPLVFILHYPLSIFSKSPWQGAQTTIHCAVTEGIEDQSGKYFSDCKVKEVTNPDAKNNDVAERLWDVSTQLVAT